ncbi:phospholipase D-like domain-containing protein [Lyngbya confervoides]|uniref:Phosphatidylserine/phosphatidylglycerophosphate/ cardiolipin synthase family protein n=1 Tax=Lyngbya confervoides BDU141951 TaxID=1574623 RepID=A0ABD4T2G6_9CYAN|nr:phosphatidylserine/phosphatidylglycerophosphate/cardiolipin synthase family protein [Lyngbya confervoides]MCM1982816.1 phosphatidylserine/phosphatidylglycerophosphate/cardiolipin synthase family protein [Lyngbya confervoides BDU141951]
MILLILQGLLVALLGLTLLILLSLYIRGAFQSSVQYRVKHAPSPSDPTLAVALSSLSTSFLSQGTMTHFWSCPDQIQQARLEAIFQAQQRIYFETFYMTPGRRARDFAAAVTQKAAEGVEVLLLLDSYGTSSLPRRYWQRLRRAGVQVVFFNSFNWRAPANFAGRTHRKLLVVDSKIALLGGAGISDDWDGDENAAPWLDIELQVEGDLIPFLEGQFLQHWTYGGGEVNLALSRFAGETQAPQAPFMITPGNNPTYRYSPIKSLKENLIGVAQERLWIASPYLLPDDNLRSLLVEAKQAGVDVRLLTACAQQIDKPYVYYAAFELYGELLAADIAIYEYQPSMIHAKMILMDRQWVNTGSANFDSRSFFHNDELDLTANAPELVKQIEQVFQQAFACSQRVTLQNWQNRSWIRHRLMGRVIGFVQWQL